MNLVKIQKPNCPACNQVGAFLDDAGVEYDKWDIMGSDEKSDKAREILGELGLFTVPVTVVLEDGKLVKHSRGFNGGELQELVDMVK
jgi:glutaredoxin